MSGAGKIYDSSELFQKIEDKLYDLDGEQVARIFNDITNETVEYVGNDQWEVVGSEETDIGVAMKELFPEDDS